MAKFIEIESIDWKERFPNCGVSAKAAYAECEKIAKAGDLTPEAVVERAARPRNPLHKIIYDKTDSEAAAEYRLSRARTMLRSFQVVYKDDDVSRQPRRAYEIVEQKKRGDQSGETATVYKSTAEAMADPESRKALVLQAWRDLVSFRSRYLGLKELEGIFASIEALEAELMPG